MGVLSSKYPNVQAVENALDKACESVSNTEFNSFKSDVYTKSETDDKITSKVSEIVADAPEDFDTLKEMSDWIANHENSASEMNSAIQTNKSNIEELETNKANSVDVYTKTESDSRFLNIDGTAVKATADGTGVNIAESFAGVKSDVAVNRTTLGTQCKNLLKNTAVTKTVSGITFTVNSDKSITINGTNESNDKVFLNICDLKSYGEGKFIVSCKSSDTNIYMSLLDERGSGLGAISDNEIIWNSTGEKRSVRFAVTGNATIDNVTVYPMIRYADILDDTYEPYQDDLQTQINNILARLTALEGGA